MFHRTKKRRQNPNFLAPRAVFWLKTLQVVSCLKWQSKKVPVLESKNLMVRFEVIVQNTGLLETWKQVLAKHFLKLSKRLITLNFEHDNQTFESIFRKQWKKKLIDQIDGPSRIEARLISRKLRLSNDTYPTLSSLHRDQQSLVQTLHRKKKFQTDAELFKQGDRSNRIDNN